MIRYTLRCAARHDFDGWFRSAEAFEGLRARGDVVCPECGSARVEKSVMAPRVAKGDDAEHPMARLRRRIESEADYVGDRFASEARAIQGGDAADRPIWGQATGADIQALARDGIAVAPLPFGPKTKMN